MGGFVVLWGKIVTYSSCSRGDGERDAGIIMLS